MNTEEMKVLSGADLADAEDGSSLCKTRGLGSRRTELLWRAVWF